MQKTKTLSRNPVICGLELKERENLKGYYECFRAPFRLDVWSYENGVSGSIFWMSSHSFFDIFAGIEGSTPPTVAFPIFHDEDSALEHVETALCEYILEVLKGLRTWMDYEQGLQNGR